jgi:hypothetical protein
LSLFAAEQLLSRFALVRLLAPLQKLLTDLPVVYRETKRDIISARRRDNSCCRVLPIDFIACPPPAKCPLGVLQSEALLPADWTTGFYPHHEVAINY